MAGRLRRANGLAMTAFSEQAGIPVLVEVLQAAFDFGEIGRPREIAFQTALFIAMEPAVQLFQKVCKHDALQ
jgi:hypothetical protein